MDVRKHEKKSEIWKQMCKADNDNHWKHKVRPSGDYYFKVKPNSEGGTAKGSNNDGVCCNACYKPRGKECDVPMRWMDIDGRSWMIGNAGRLSARKRASATKCDEAWIMCDATRRNALMQRHKTRQGDKVKHDKATGGNATMRLGETRQGYWRKHDNATG
ncbi:hypothetical protein F4604DRAFT_1685972 [Suillus subluteus]|nr:hypothetical protein F4604DRAFT_1685972 [Suillus subluteus]